MNTIHARRQSLLAGFAATAAIFSLSLGSGCTSARYNRAQAEPDYVAGDAVPSVEMQAVSPSQALQRLMDGNGRFVSGNLQHPHQTPETRVQLAAGQAPFAVILGCADSRTGPEVIFDQGLGDLFVARVAGNVADDHVIGSIEYAVEHLHAPLIVVVGHSKCGAVMAARDVVAADGHAEGHIEAIVQSIRPAVEQTVGEDVAATCKANIRDVVRQLREAEPILNHAVEAREITIVGAYYDLETGEVTFLQD